MASSAWYLVGARQEGKAESAWPLLPLETEENRRGFGAGTLIEDNSAAFSTCPPRGFKPDLATELNCLWMLHALAAFGFPRWHSGKEPACQCRSYRFDPWNRKIPWSRKWQPPLVFLPGKFHRQRSLVGYSPWSCRVRHDWTHTHISTDGTKERVLWEAWNKTWAKNKKCSKTV